MAMMASNGSVEPVVVLVVAGRDDRSVVEPPSRSPAEPAPKALDEDMEDWTWEAA
jgi:hypothetical protein